MLMFISKTILSLRQSKLREISFKVPKVKSTTITYIVIIILFGIYTRYQ